MQTVGTASAWLTCIHVPVGVGCIRDVQDLFIAGFGFSEASDSAVELQFEGTVLGRFVFHEVQDLNDLAGNIRLHLTHVNKALAVVGQWGLERGGRCLLSPIGDGETLISVRDIGSRISIIQSPKAHIGGVALPVHRRILTKIQRLLVDCFGWEWDSPGTCYQETLRRRTCISWNSVDWAETDTTISLGLVLTVPNPQVGAVRMQRFVRDMGLSSRVQVEGTDILFFIEGLYRPIRLVPPLKEDDLLKSGTPGRRVNTSRRSPQAPAFRDSGDLL
ncbi:hypothetical protein HGA91_05480 [candidate division WWE3 bacterium]|nr:hypothetical protein [candidate division WWE3 bacterium]